MVISALSQQFPDFSPSQGFSEQKEMLGWPLSIKCGLHRILINSGSQKTHFELTSAKLPGEFPVLFRTELGILSLLLSLPFPMELFFYTSSMAVFLVLGSLSFKEKHI